MADRPNFYEALELDPGIDDWPTIEARLLEKKRRWSVEETTGSPNQRRRAQLFRSLMGEMEAVLRNEASRRQEAQQARDALIQRRQAKERDLAANLEVLRASGGYTQAQLDLLAKKYEGDFAKHELEKRIAALGIPCLDTDSTGSAGARKPRVGLDDTTKAALRRELLILRVADLYELLGLSPRISARSLYERADELNREMLRIGKTDPESSAKKSLYGICLKLFKTEEEKGKYDVTRSFECMEKFDSQIEVAGQSDGILNRAELDVILKLARQENVDPELAQEYIQNFAAKKDLRIERGTRLPSLDLQQCGYCSRLASTAGQDKCDNCGEPLQIPCPRCGTVTPTQNTACSKCNCLTGEAPLVNALLKDGHRLIAGGDSLAALQKFDAALLQWPEWEPALQGRAEAIRRREEREQALLAVEVLVRDRRMVEARKALGRFRRDHGDAGVLELEREIRAGIEGAEKRVREAEALARAGQGEAGVDCYLAALAECVDLDAALVALRAAPPPPPSGLVVALLADGHHLSWTPATSRGALRYVVVRKGPDAPAHPGDGTIVGEYASPAADDIGLGVGLPWHYAVFSLRAGVHSATAARSGPHLRMAEVTDLEVSSGSGQIRLAWTCPPGCKRIEVRRQAGRPPASVDEGTPVPVVGPQAIDRGLANGEAYGYLAVAVYDDPCRPGRELFTPGVRQTAVPELPPPAVTDLTCRREGRLVTMSWSQPTGSVVQVRRAKPGATLYPAGQVLPLGSADLVGDLLPAQGTGLLQFPLASQGEFLFVPLTIGSSVIVVGQSVTLTTVDDVSQLRCAVSGRNLVLTWQWPEGIEEALIALSYAGYPTAANDESAVRSLVTRRQYERSNCWELRGAEPRPHYFTVFCKAPGSSACSGGTRIMHAFGQGAQVGYRVARRRSGLIGPAREFSLELTSSDVETLASVVVVAKQGQLPVSPSDGHAIVEVERVTFAGGKARIDIPRQHCRPNQFVRLFFREESAGANVRLLPAKKDELHLG